MLVGAAVAITGAMLGIGALLTAMVHRLGATVIAIGCSRTKITVTTFFW